MPAASFDAHSERDNRVCWPTPAPARRLEVIEQHAATARTGVALMTGAPLLHRLLADVLELRAGSAEGAW